MISYVNEALFRQDSIKKNLIITDGNSIELTNSDIYQGEFSLREAICSENNILFGSCEASEMNFTTSKTNISFIGKELNASLVLNNDTQNPFEYGTYIVVEDKLTSDRSKREVKAYDRIYVINNADVTSWYNSLSFPLTLLQFRNSFFSHLGITQVSATLINDSLVIQKTIESNKISGADIVRAICEINAVFGHMTRDDKFEYITLSNTSAYSVSTSMYRKLVYEDYVCQRITGLQIRSEAYDIGVQVGTNENPYIIEGNFLIAGLGTSELSPIANAILEQISTLNSYTPLTVECIGNPCVEVGDLIDVTQKDESVVSTWIMKRTLTGIQALFDNLESSGEEYRSEEMNGIPYQITQLRGKSNVLERSIEETRSTISDVESGLRSEIVQTAAGLEVQIESLQEQIDGEMMYFEREGVPTLLNYPYWDFCTNIPCDNTVQTTNDLRFVYSEQDKQDHLRDLCMDTTNLVSYRFVKENGVWKWKEIADSEISTIMRRITEVEITTEGIETQVAEIQTNYATKSEVSSSISQSSSQILSTVSSTYTTKTTTNTMQSQINQQASQISAKVSQTGGNNSSFGWSLTSSEFALWSANTKVFSCNSGGITVNGYTKSTEIAATYATISSLNANIANVNNLIAQKASISDLNATNARFNNLNASNITAGTLSVARFNVNGSGYIDTFSGRNLTMQSAQVRWLMMYDQTTQYFRQITLQNGRLVVS